MERSNLKNRAVEVIGVPFIREAHQKFYEEVIDKLSENVDNIKIHSNKCALLLFKKEYLDEANKVVDEIYSNSKDEENDYNRFIKAIVFYLHIYTPIENPGIDNVTQCCVRKLVLIPSIHNGERITRYNEELFGINMSCMTYDDVIDETDESFKKLYINAE